MKHAGNESTVAAPLPHAARLAECPSTVAFAAKTTASGLSAPVIAFTLNLDQPQWALLTVFIVAQPRSGLVLATRFYRIIGTFSLARPSRCVLSASLRRSKCSSSARLRFGSGCAPCGSQYARNFAAYTLSCPATQRPSRAFRDLLDAGQAFYVATARYRNQFGHHRESDGKRYHPADLARGPN
jgi:hypothetical protein